MSKHGYKIYIETFGCQMNVSYSERMATNLVRGGHQIIHDEMNADVVLLNTCSVREKAENKLFTRIGQVRTNANKPLIGVAGCVAQLEGEELFKRAHGGVDFVLGTRALGRINELIEKSAREKEPVWDLGERETDADWSVGQVQRHSPYTAFVPIIEGCNKFCTYCIVPFSRGREKSLSARLIIEQVKQLQVEGFQEVHLIGQNVNSYRPSSLEGLEDFRGATPFVKLLRAVAATGFERIKFTTSFPRDFHPDIIAAIDENENLCNWVHLPVQSGSPQTLKAMRRGHSVADYLKRVEAIRNSPRQIALSTDLIVGFPGETDKDFRETLQLYEQCRFDSAYLFKYSPRKGTPAAEKGDDIADELKTARFLELEKVQRRIQRESFDGCIGRTMKVLAEKQSAKSPDDFSGHTTCHRVVNFRGEPQHLGTVLEISVTESKVNSLYGEICR